MPAMHIQCDQTFRCLNTKLHIKWGWIFLLWLEIINGLVAGQLGVVCGCLDGASLRERKLVKPVSLNCDVGSDKQARYLPSKYFNPQLITWWVWWAEAWGSAVVAWYILPRSDTPSLSLSPRGLWEESTTGRPLVRAAEWRAAVASHVTPALILVCRKFSHFQIFIF